MKFRFNNDFDKIAPINNIQKTQSGYSFGAWRLRYPHSPFAQGQALEKASNREKSHLWIVLDKGHSNWESHPEFWARIEDFMKKYLPVS